MPFGVSSRSYNARSGIILNDIKAEGCRVKLDMEAIWKSLQP
jgi:hypothetical protein